MTTLANQNAIPEPTLTLVKGGSSAGSSDNSGSITQGGMNPSAAAMLILYQVMGMYSIITGINAQEQKTQISAQKNMGKAEAKATVKAGEALGWSMIAGAIASILFTAFGTAVAISSTKTMKSMEENTKVLETKIAPAKSIDEMDLSYKSTSPESGEDLEGVSPRALEFERGDYTNGLGEKDTNEAAIKELRQDPEKYQAFRDRLDNRLATFEKARNSNASNAQSTSQIRSTVGQSITGVGNSLSSVSQGTGQMFKAQDDANASLQRSANSMAQQTASSQQQAATKAGDAQNAVVNVLNAIRQASSNV